MRSRRRILMVIAVVAVVATGLGVVVGRQLTSPADAAARTAAPPASRITVPVEQRALSSRVVGRGDASFDGAVNVTIETGGLQTRPVVTGRVPKVGATVTEGKPLLEVAGRPVLALAGGLPMYRTLRPGLRGPDVRQLERVLDRLGYDPGTVDDRYTAATSRAVVRLYDAAGYEPPAADEQLSQAVEQAQQQADQARERVRSAEAALDRARQGPTPVQRIQADNAVEEAERSMADARRPATPRRSRGLGGSCGSSGRSGRNCSRPRAPRPSGTRGTRPSASTPTPGGRSRRPGSPRGYRCPPPRSSGSGPCPDASTT